MKYFSLVVLLSVSYYTMPQENPFGNNRCENTKSIARSLSEDQVVPFLRSGIESIPISSNPTGTSSEVGVTQGDLSVSLTGAATYSIPIAIPPGVNSIVPQIALTYSSQAGNGVAGFGWNISGVSVITRIASSKFHDNVIDEIDFDASDRFAIDGQRLIVKQGTAGVYGASGTVYETESFSNVQVTSYGVHPFGANYGPAYFVVRYPDGSIAQYGNSSNSRTVTDWAINYWQNAQGVRINYSYTMINNNLSIASILYGARNSSPHMNEIRFIYKNRVRAEQAFIGSQSLIRNTILSNIQVFGNGQGFRKYVLTHQTTTLGYERLFKITESNWEETVSFNPTVFKYEDTSNVDLFQITSTIPLNLNNISAINSSALNGDFDGDGSQDVIIYPITGANSKKKYHLYTDLNGTSTNIGIEHTIGDFKTLFATTWLSWNNYFMPSQGWCAVKYDDTSNITTFDNYSSGNASSIYFQYSRTYTFPNITNTANGAPVYINKDFYSGDFNADGLTDVIIIEKNTSYTSQAAGITINQTYTGGATYFLDLDRRITNNYINTSGVLSINDDTKITTSDCNGDGKTDLMVFNNGNLKVYSVNDQKQLIQTISFNDNSIVTDKPAFFGDFNGDGKQDFVIPQSKTNDIWAFFFSRGNNFHKVVAPLGYTYATAVLAYPGIVGWDLTEQSLIEPFFIPNDINGDGKTDIIVQVNYTCSGNTGCDAGTPQVSRFYIFENLGFNGTTISFGIQYVAAQYGGIGAYPIPVFTDNNKKNLDLTYSLLSGSGIKTFQSTKDTRLDTRLKEIVVGNGVKETITYEMIKAQSGDIESVYTPVIFTDSYPAVDLKVAAGFCVVAKFEQLTANQYKKQKFRYLGATSNLEGIGFMGFRALAKTNWHTDDNQIITTVTKHDLSRRGAITESYSVTGEVLGNFLTYTPSTFVSKSILQYQSQLLSNKVFKSCTTFSNSYNGLENTSVEATTSYDVYNNPLNTTTVTKNGGVVEKTDVLTLEYYPPVNASLYSVGRTKKKTFSTSHDGITLTGEEIYTFNSAQLVSKIQKKGHLTNFLTEDNLYDSFGNLTQKTITAQGLPTRVTKYTYDATGRFLTTSTDIEGLITQYQYDLSKGLLLATTKPSNTGYPLITTYLYDYWGKITQTTDYLGKKVFTSYYWLNPSINGMYAIQESGEDDSLSISWFDDLGREIASGYKTINDNSQTSSNLNWTVKEFNIYDQPLRNFQPFLSDTPLNTGLFTSTTYDIYGRPTQVLEHTGKTTLFSYNGLSMVASSGATQKTTIKNSLGYVISTEDNGGLVLNKYYPNGNLKASNFGGIITTVEQDGWGRKASISDPSAGVISYQYNEFGELVRETNPKGNTRYTYDSFGKLIEKIVNGSSGDLTNTRTQYIYDNTSKLLTTVVYNDYQAGTNSLHNYEYDNYRRQNFSQENTVHARFSRRRTYDSFGRVEKDFYSATNISDGKQSEKWIKNIYKFGQLQQIVDDQTSQILWQIQAVDANGNIVQARLGNEIKVTNTFDQFGYPTQFKHDKDTNPSVNVLTLNTQFSAQKGNLLSRYSSLFNYSEDFVYDDLDRLTNWTEDAQEICGCNFNSSTHDFTPVNNATVTLSNNRLSVNGTVGTSGKGTEKKITSNAAIGTKISISGNLQINTATSGTLLRISFYSKNPTTGATIGFSTAGMPLSNGNFNFGTEISSNTLQDVYVLFMMQNPSNPAAFMAVSFDDIKISIEMEGQQTYDNLARIDFNNIGEYNYTNSSKPYQQTSVVPNSLYANYYQSRSPLDISYNVFKSPVSISEFGQDKLDFLYNPSNGRSTVYYGSLEEDKLQRKFRKHYSADGSMEIKHNRVTGEVEFLTFLGGDAYTAPVILRSDGTSQRYYYLHRDHLGSIVAVTDQGANVIEKRLFDAWGNIKKVQTGNNSSLAHLTFIDRGYTGHEHLKGVNLIHMNARLYDPLLHRFLQPDNFIADPTFSQSFNRYSYVLNNPLKFTDVSGELPVVVVGLIVGAIAGAAGYVGYAIQTGSWSWGGFGMAVLGGAAAGAIMSAIPPAATSLTFSSIGSAAASAFAGSFFPAYNLPIGDWNISISPTIAFGNATGAGAAVGVSYSDGDWTVSGGVGVMQYSNYNGFGANTQEMRYSALINYDDGKTGFTLGTNFWRGSAGSDGKPLNQRTGMIGFHSGDFNLMYENDGGAGINHLGLGDGGDSYRTAALNLSIGDFNAGFNLMTGLREDSGEKFILNRKQKYVNPTYNPQLRDGFDRKFKHGFTTEVGNKYRLGALSVGYKGFRIGVNSEHIRHAIQNRFIHNLIGDRGFENQSWNWSGYFQYKPLNSFTSW